MYSYIAQLIHVANRMGIESTMVYSSEAEPQIANLMHYDEPVMTIAHGDALQNDCINIFHSGVPDIFPELPNKVYDTHGMPQWIARDMDSLEYTAEMVRYCDLVLTRWKQQIPYWQALTDKPVRYVPPGVDLQLWKPEGPKKQFSGETVLWADSWRDGIKEPWELLYKSKGLKLKLVNIPEEKRQLVYYLVEKLGLDIEYPIEGNVGNIADYYRGADYLYSSIPLDYGDNMIWEARACGCTVIDSLDLTPMSRDDNRKLAPDIEHTILWQTREFEEAFNT